MIGFKGDKIVFWFGSQETNDFLIYASELSELIGKSYLLEKVKKLMS